MNQTNQITWFPACLVLLACFALLSGCIEETKPDELFQLTPESLRNRAMSTRVFETPNEKELLSASAAVLQDLGFQVEESQPEVGYFRAVKERSARERRQYFHRVVFFFLSLGSVVMPVDLHQKIVAALVTRPLNPQATKQEVRISLFRVVWKGDGQANRQYIPPGEQYMEMIRDPEIYQQFFAKLSKAVFLEAQDI
jgi:hypothetical protein